MIELFKKSFINPFSQLIIIGVLTQAVFILCWIYFYDFFIHPDVALYISYIISINSCYKNLSDVKRNKNNMFGIRYLFLYQFVLTMAKFLLFNKLIKGSFIPNSIYFYTILSIFTGLIWIGSRTSLAFFERIY